MSVQDIAKKIRELLFVDLNDRKGYHTGDLDAEVLAEWESEWDELITVALEAERDQLKRRYESLAQGQKNVEANMRTKMKFLAKRACAGYLGWRHHQQRAEDAEKERDEWRRRATRVLVVAHEQQEKAEDAERKLAELAEILGKYHNGEIESIRYVALTAAIIAAGAADAGEEGKA